MTAHFEEKPPAKAVLREVIEAQPDDASYEEIMRELAFEHMIERGLADVRAGHSVNHDEAVRRVRSWWDSGGSGLT
jgi:predicted transcriptional regulator